MTTLRTLALAAALGISTAALAQTQTPPEQPGTESSPQTTGSPEPDAASSPHQREATSTPTTGQETAPTQTPDPSAASSPHQREAVGATPGSTAAEAPKLVGLQVVTSSGEEIGAVTDVMADSATGAPTYVVIAAVPASAGTDSTAIPYGTATSMVRDGKLIIEQEKLAGAPKVDSQALKDPASTAWQSESDSYWGNTRAASKESMQVPKPNDRG
jgi:sporulation protein YlmC with PRC-barrel domain